MKVFISGSHSITPYCESGQLPERVLMEIDKHLDANDTIFVGDCAGTDALVQQYLESIHYRNVKVYVSGVQDQTRFNAGKWEEKHFQPAASNGYSFYLEKDLHMAEDADAGLAIWDGTSKGTYINMVCLVAQGKPCHVYLLKDQTWISVGSLNELETYAGPYEDWNPTEVKYILSECGFSEEMQTFLSSPVRVSTKQLIAVVCQAPISLQEKHELLVKIGEKINLKHDAWMLAKECEREDIPWDNLGNGLRAIAGGMEHRSVWSYHQTVLKELCKAEMKLMTFDIAPEIAPGLDAYYLFEEWYNTDSFVKTTYDNGLFLHPEGAAEYAKKADEDVEADEGWYRLAQWELYDSQWEEDRYDYYIYRGEICWFERLSTINYNGQKRYIPTSSNSDCWSSGLNLETPFRTGDIVLIDCRPFGPPFHALFLVARNRESICFPYIMYRIPFTDRWALKSLKSGAFFHSEEDEDSIYKSRLSPLYRIRRIQPEEMETNDETLKRFSEALSGDEKKAEAVKEEWIAAQSEKMSVEEVDALVEKHFKWGARKTFISSQ